MKTVAMLRRRSEFFVFLDSVRPGKPEKEEPKEESQLSPYEDYLQLLLQMKFTSAVSETTQRFVFIRTFICMRLTCLICKIKTHLDAI